MGDLAFPLLLMCGFLAAIMLITIGSSYLWLLWYHAVMTKCPQCGRRGAGELLESKTLDSTAHTQWKDAQKVFGRGAGRRRQVRVTKTTYEDHFECKYCGHQWTETARETKHEAVQ